LAARIGVLSGVAREALRFSFNLAAEGTNCQGAVLDIEEVAISVFCPNCQLPQQLVDCWHFICPVCGSPTPDLLTGRELDLVSIEIEMPAPADC
jgi:hydrogenase nickel incorporation protein HypA/HybF